MIIGDIVFQVFVYGSIALILGSVGYLIYKKTKKSK